MARRPGVSRDSVAYEESFQQPVRGPETRREPLRVIRPRRRVSWLPQMVCMLMVAGVASLLICCQMRLTELTAQVSAQQGQLQDLQDEYVSLKTQQDQKLNLSYVENYAQNKLGMVKMDGSAVEYIEMNNPDRIEVTKRTNSLFAAISKATAAISAYLQ